MMNTNLRLTVNKPRSGRTPAVGSSAAETPLVAPMSSSERELNVQSARRNLEILDDLAENFSRDKFDDWMKTMLAESAESPIVAQLPEVPQSTSTCLTKRNLKGHFDLLTDGGGVREKGMVELAEWDCDESQVPECIKKIREAMKINSELSKLRKENDDAELKAQSQDYLKFDAMVTEMEKNVIPALNKLSKEPTRFHDMVRKEVPKNGVLPCNIEDQRALVDSLIRLSEDCRQLYDLELSSNDLEKEFEFLRELATLVDSKMNIKAAEKLKLKRMEKLLETCEYGDTDSPT